MTIVQRNSDKSKSNEPIKEAGCRGIQVILIGRYGRKPSEN